MRNPIRTTQSRRSRKARAAAATPSPDTLAPPDLRTFTIDFFRLFGAEVTALDKRKAGPLRVHIPAPSEALAEHFGGDDLLLAFQSVEAGSGQQLVAHGSRTFDHMLAFIERRSALTVRRLPVRHAGSEGLMRAVRPRNAGITNLRLREQPEPRYAFHWRITYRADDKREELYTVVLDEQGNQILLAQPGAAAPSSGAAASSSGVTESSAPWPASLDALLADSEEMPPPPEAPVRNPRLDPLPAEVAADAAVELVAEGADAGVDDDAADAPPITAVREESAPVAGTAPAPEADDALDADDAPAPGAPPRTGPRLPPITQLVRMAETARKFAVYHADLRCAAHEAEILPRLYKALNRLTTYYGQQIEEMRGDSDPDGEKRIALEADLERKRAEEIENHRLHVRVELTGYAILYVPTAVAEMTLTDGAVEARLRVRLDRYSGALTRPICHACGRETEDVILCRNGHVACDDCLRQCENCGDTLCAACGVEPCPVCGRANCDQCGSTCWACGGRACPDHASRCPICGDIVCHACQAECAECGTRQCRSHLRADAVLNADGSSSLVCAVCAVRCPGCNQYSARLGTCAISGQRFCRNCLVTCHDCGRMVGPGFYINNVQGEPYCKDCVVTCPSCGAVTADTQPCATCGAACCEACGRRCDVCGKLYCQEHSEVVASCGHILCHHHAAICAIGMEPVCTICSEPCAICGLTHCASHQVACKWCGHMYCSNCVSASSGLCITCGSLMRHGTPVDIMQEPCAASLDVQAIAPKFHWRSASNSAVTVYAGANGMSAVLVIARNYKGGRLVVVTRKLNAIDMAAGFMRR